MKQTIRVAVIFFMMAALAFIPPKHNIVGRWITYNPDGSIGYVDFSKDGTFKVTSTDGQLYHQGKYKLENDVFSLNDEEGCGSDYWGKYKFTFIGEDSIQTSLIEDSCTGRKQQLTTGNTGIKRMAMSK